MFGPDVLVAPILYEDVRERQVYLPEGRWININDGSEWDGRSDDHSPGSLRGNSGIRESGN